MSDPVLTIRLLTKLYSNKRCSAHFSSNNRRRVFVARACWKNHYGCVQWYASLRAREPATKPYRLRFAVTVCREEMQGRDVWKRGIEEKHGSRGGSLWQTHCTANRQE